MQLNLIKILAFISIFFLFVQCKKDPIVPDGGRVIGTVKLTNAELGIVPYELGDTIVFIDSLGNTKTFYTESRKISYQKTIKSGTGYNPDYYNIEKLRVQLKSTISHANWLDLHLRAPLPSDISKNHPGKCFFTLDFSYGNNMSPFSVYTTAQNFEYYYKKIPVTHYNSYTILGHTFNDVYEFYNYYNGHGVVNKVFYTRHEGIVGFIMDDGKKWYLSN